MRSRIGVVAAVLSMLVVVAVPGSAAARVQHPRNHRLTITAAPDPIVAGDNVLVYGRLAGPNSAGKTVRLYQHLAGSGRGYSQVAHTTTDTFGFYEFVEGPVNTNRDWFVTAPGGAFSRTVRERVAADVTVTANTTTADTRQPITFSGSVTPNHQFERVLLQEQDSMNIGWHTLRTALLGRGSGYSVRYAWRTPGERDVRVVLTGDARNIRSESDAVGVTIQQAQVKGFTINTSNPVTPYQTPVTISGVITPGATAQPAMVQLWARQAPDGAWQLVNEQQLGSGGSYSFTENPSVNTIYQARTTFGAVRASADLFQGVRDVVAMQATPSTTPAGVKVAFFGTVAPDKAGRVIYLQRLLPNGVWESVEASYVRPGSTFQFGWRFGKPGSYQFRARIYSDRDNVGAASNTVPVTVSGIAPITTLPSSS